jgi:hypothetical protein
MSEQSDYQEAREAIAKETGEDRWRDSFYGDYVTEQDREAMRKFADKLLHLAYSDGSPMIGVLAKDQTKPSFRNAVNKSYNDYMLGQEDMVKAGFRRVAKEE